MKIKVNVNQRWAFLGKLSRMPGWLKRMIDAGPALVAVMAMRPHHLSTAGPIAISVTLPLLYLILVEPLRHAVTAAAWVTLAWMNWNSNHWSSAVALLMGLPYALVALGLGIARTNWRPPTKAPQE